MGTVSVSAPNGHAIRRVHLHMPRLRRVPASMIANPENYDAHLRLLNNSLLLASALGRFSEAEMALSRDAIVDAVDMDLNTAMHHVSIRGFTIFGARLLDGWDALINPRNRQDKTPLALCSAAGNGGTVKMMAVRYPNSVDAKFEFLEAAELAEKYGQERIAALLRRIAKEGTGFLKIRAPKPARTVSSPHGHIAAR